MNRKKLLSVKRSRRPCSSAKENRCGMRIQKVKCSGRTTKYDDIKERWRKLKRK